MNNELHEEITKVRGVDPEIDQKIRTLDKTIDLKLILLAETPKNAPEADKLQKEILDAQKEVVELLNKLLE